ncbi:MAG: radical SAM protein [Desulfomonilaceae bacterium]
MAGRRQSFSGIPVALVYPNASRVGLSNLGFQFVSQVWDAHPLFSVERFFVETGDRPDLKDFGCVVSEKGNRSLGQFPVIAFSLPFENDYPAVIRALLTNNIPCIASRRGAQDPLVLAGGVSISLNPEPLAPFLDVIFVGEIEEADGWSRFLETLASIVAEKSRRKKWDRSELLRFRETPGAYVPEAYRFQYRTDGRVDRIEAEPGFALPVPALKRTAAGERLAMASVENANAVFDQTLLVEINRGCGHGCRFCTSGWIHRPVRYRSFDQFCRQIADKDLAGKTVGLIGSDLAGHPQLHQLLEFIAANGAAFSLSSIRPEGLTPQLLTLIAATGQKTLTLAPETASPRMKKIIGKTLPDDLFFEKIEWLVAAGIANVRFYFMVGLPTETDEDIVSIVDFVLRARGVFVAASRSMKKIGRISVQINAFVPKPWTPFQWAAMESPKNLERKIKIIREGLSSVPNITPRAESVRESVVQGYISRGDRRVGLILYDAIERQRRLPSVLREPRANAGFYLHRERDRDEVFPWDAVDHGVKKQILRQIYEKALSAAETVNGGRGANDPR